MSDWIKLAVGGLVVFTLLCAGVSHYMKFESRRSARAHTIEYTRQDLRNIGLGLLTICELERKQLWDVREAERAVNGHELFELLVQSNEALKVARPTDTSTSRSSFCDRWGNEIHGQINLRGDQMHVVLWSNGPNRRDELGNGDDIVELCDITIPRTTAVTHP